MSAPKVKLLALTVTKFSHSKTKISTKTLAKKKLSTVNIVRSIISAKLITNVSSNKLNLSKNSNMIRVISSKNSPTYKTNSHPTSTKIKN
jgi:hypothetical protein